jgi:hypothetical protein
MAMGGFVKELPLTTKFCCRFEQDRKKLQVAMG